jgi:hypothetical protein
VTGSVFVVSARVALLFVAFRAILSNFIVVAPPGYGWNPIPGQGGTNPYPPGNLWPPIPSIPPYPTGGGTPSPPPFSFAPSPPPFAFTSPSPPPLLGAPSPPPPSGTPPNGQCGTGDLAFSCTGECGLCIFFPGNEDPNCCCDDTCTEFGDCCDDFDACCPANGAKFAFLQKLETREKVARARGDTAVQTSAVDEGREARRRRPARVRVVDVSARRAKGGSARVAARSARILDLD